MHILLRMFEFTVFFVACACMLVLHEFYVNDSISPTANAAVVGEYRPEKSEILKPVREESVVDQLPVAREEEAAVAGSFPTEASPTPVSDAELPIAHTNEPVLAPPVNSNPPQAPAAENRERTNIATAIAQRIHIETNQARKNSDVANLTLDSELTRLAQTRSEDMAAGDYFSHTSPDGCGLTCHFQASGYEASTWGENIAWYEPYSSLTNDALAQKFVEDWLGSSGHRENLLSTNFTHEGVGVAVVGEKIIITVIFARPK
jgi:uncharacterized protein YkwD